MFLVILLLLWLIAVMLFISDPKNQSARWFSLMIFWAGIGVLNPVIRQTIIPYVTSRHHTEIIGFLQVSANVFYILTMLFSPYCLLMLGISNTGNPKWLKCKNNFAVILLIPVAAMLSFFKVSPATVIPDPRPAFQTNSILWYIVLLSWVTPYVAGAAYLLISSYLTTKNLQLKQERQQLCLTIIPPAILAFYLFYISPLAGLVSPVKYSFIIPLYVVLLFCFFAVRGSILGVKISIEKQQLTGTVHATFLGAAMLNHVLKNEILKIDICMNNLIHYFQISDPNISELLQSIASSNSHLLALMNRIHGHIQEIVLSETPTNLLELVEQSLALALPQLQAKNVNIIKDYHLEKALILCDAVHIREVLRNIIINAIEAMNAGGELNIQLYKKNRRIFLAITDNGMGISKKDLPHVMKPFYSTKNRKQNFGLGLTYCYNIMQKHGGILDILSEKEIGTTVFIGFPASKVLTAKVHLGPGITA